MLALPRHYYRADPCPASEAYMLARCSRLCVVAVVALAIGMFSSWHHGAHPAVAGSGFVDLVLTKSDSAEPVLSGSSLTYTVVVVNTGDMAAGSQATPVRIVDQLPSQYTVTSFSVDQGGLCSLTVLSQLLTCTLETLGPGESATVTIGGYATMPSGGQIANAAVVDLPVSQIPETIDTLNNVDTETTTTLAIATPTLPPTSMPTPPTPPSVGGASHDVVGGGSAQDQLMQVLAWAAAALAAGAFVAAVRPAKRR